MKLIEPLICVSIHPIPNIKKLDQAVYLEEEPISVKMDNWNRKVIQFRTKPPQVKQIRKKLKSIHKKVSRQYSCYSAKKSFRSSKNLRIRKKNLFFDFSKLHVIENHYEN